MNFGFSGEMMFLFFLALILFGPKKLPEIGRQIGRIMNEFRRASNEFRSQIESEIHSLERETKPQIQAPLGSLASRILNPPPAEEMKAADERAAEAKAAEANSAVATASETSRPAPGHATVETGADLPAGSPAISSNVTASNVTPSKVAPDA